MGTLCSRACSVLNASLCGSSISSAYMLLRIACLGPQYSRNAANHSVPTALSNTFCQDALYSAPVIISCLCCTPIFAHRPVLRLIRIMGVYQENCPQLLAWAVKAEGQASEVCLRGP